MCFYDADTHEISHAPAPPRVYAAGSFASDGTAINNVAYNCSCVSYTMIEDKLAEYLKKPFRFGRRPVQPVNGGRGFDQMEAGHYKIIFDTPLAHVNYSITVQPQVVRHDLQLTSDVVKKKTQGPLHIPDMWHRFRNR